MGKFIDMTGWEMSEHGVPDSRLTVIEYVGKSMWLCECNCDKHSQIHVNGFDIRSGHTKSCGCLHSELLSQNNQAIKKKYNRFELVTDKDGNEYYKGWTHKNEEFWISVETYEKGASKICWSYHHSGYLYGYLPDKQRLIMLHVYAMEPQDGVLVDHIKHPPLGQQQVDNRLSNLRLVTTYQNMMNKSLYKNNSTGVTGVSRTSNGRYRAGIQVNGNSIHLGVFSSLECAAIARRNAEKLYQGGYAYKNNN